MLSMRRVLVLVGVVALLSAACTGGSDASRPLPAKTSSAAGTAPAPEFPAGLDWLNVDHPLTLDDLRGKVVLLDFWTYGCINCIHIIPDLKRLEAEYADNLVVVGVHSAKFSNEANTDNISEVIQRYDLHHPVVNDADFEIWDAWGVRAWPTVAIIDPAGNIVGTHAGEGVYDVVHPVVSNLVAEFSANGALDPTPLQIRLERDRSPSTVLSYPGKVFADPSSDRIFIADTGHNRIVVANDDGTVTAVFGSGMEGFEDGIGINASFSSPQGLVARGDTLYVADTNNHAIRTVSLATGAVTTLAGTGAGGRSSLSGPVDGISLNSPWALELDGDLLLVANAGTHQIWTIDLANGTAEPTVGSGAEGTTNGPLAEASLAQPSGLALGADGTLYFADSESSSIRSASIGAPEGETALVAGAPGSLFEFGDEDGEGTGARFQHPLGITRRGDLLLVADTYNSKIKEVDPSTGRTTTLFGSEPGWRDGTDPLFYEPGGLSSDGETLWIADTNNHSIRHVDFETGAAGTLVLNGLDAFVNSPNADAFVGKIITVPMVSSGKGDAELVLDVQLPAGYKVNEEASSSLLLISDGGVATFPSGDRIDLTGTAFPVVIPVVFHEGLGSVTADLGLVWCRVEAEGLCLFEQMRFEVPLDVTGSGPSASIRLPLELQAPES
jgi:thiol-disulfide isomerase/thioredoxin